jgi:PPOX class probable F420-dependent enzyme
VPKPPVPETFHPLLTSQTLGHLATIGPTGRPEVNPIWFLWEDGQLLISVKPETRKYKNLRTNPACALSVLDAGNPGHYVELRGEVNEFELYEDISFVNLLARKYTGADFAHGHPGEHRYKVTIQVNSWTGQ